MRLLVVTAIYPTPDRPAFGSFVRTQVESLRRAGLDVDVLVLDGANRKLMYAAAVLQLRARLAEQPADIVHAHYSYVGAVAVTQRRVPVVLTYHGDDILGTVGPEGRLERWSIPVRAGGRALGEMVDAVIVQTEEMARRFRRRDVHVIPHEVDLEVFQPTARDVARVRLGLHPDRPHILFAAPPDIPVKNFPLARDAVDLVRRNHPAVELHVVHREPQPRLALWMSACDALVFPSWQEGSPNVIKQAMACNLPIVAADVGDVRRLIGATEGCHVVERSVDAFAARLADELHRPRRTDGRSAVAHLAADRVSGRVAAVYDDVLARRSGALRGAGRVMCGIAGVHEHDGRRVDPTVARAMLSAIVHRGPDDEGLHLAEGIALGARRLSIIDLPGGHQPISNEDGSVVVAYNGEIYNYRALRERLLRNGHRLRTHSDTEVIVHLYEELGDACVHELDGMFAFALWDSSRRRLLLVRDRLGIKPLYYSHHGGRLLFGSEIKALLRHPAAEAAVDLDALAAFLLLKYVPAPRTMFDGIAALPPGHMLTSDRTGVRVAKWWDVSFHRAAPEPGEEEAARVLRRLLEEAVRSHLVSDVPFGAFLSGGIDSSLVVALMSRELSTPVRTFAVGFSGPGEEMSELPYARLVADRYETDHHEVIVGASDLVDLAGKVVWHLDQPIADNACLANHLVAELASHSVKMVLTGEGGDELFAGYARYAGERFAPLARRLPANVRAFGARISRRSPGMTRPSIALHALCQAEEARRFATWFPLMRLETRAELGADALADAIERAAPETLFAEPISRTDAPDALSRMLYVDTKLWLPDDLLARGDKMSMAASLEARVPLLDHRLVEFAASLPPGLKVKGLSRKYLLRRVARDLLPEPVLRRRKKGFPIPMAAWLRGGAREMCRDLLAPETVRRRGLFEPQAVARLLTEHDAGADHGAALWALLSVELWHQAFLDHATGLAEAA